MNDTPAEREDQNIWARLRRRKVVQWSVAYVAAAWALLQGLQFLSDTYDWPSTALRVVTLALALGLPIASTLAWYHGDRGEQRIRGTELSILALLMLLGGGVVRYYQHAVETSTVTPAALSAPPIPTNASIAVLPFVNMSGDPADEYFSDGLAEELLNSLTRIDGLKVAARTTVQGSHRRRMDHHRHQCPVSSGFMIVEVEAAASPAMSGGAQCLTLHSLIRL